MMTRLRFRNSLALTALAFGVMLATARLTSPHPTYDAESSSHAPAGLLCESMPEPLGIGIALPRLSWQLTDVRRGSRQTAYQIQVGSSMGGADVWDSGRVESNE